MTSPLCSLTAPLSAISGEKSHLYSFQPNLYLWALLRLNGKKQRKRAELVLRKDSRVFSDNKRSRSRNFRTQVRLSSVGCVRLVDRRGYLTVVLPRFKVSNQTGKTIPFPSKFALMDLISQGGTGQSATAST